MSHGLKIINGDLSIGKDGKLIQVRNEEKLLQDVLKITLTPAGSNPFFPAYGSLITQNIIGNVLDFEISSSLATNILRNSIETLQKLQALQTSYQIVTAKEQIASILEVKVQRNTIDPRYYTVTIKLLNKAIKELETGFEFDSTS